MSSAPFPIDFVWTFCSNANNKVMSSYTPRRNQLPVYCQAVDDLRFSLRSVCMNANFFRYVWVIIADQDQLPSYLKQNKQIKVVKHSEFIPSNYLPCFNTNVIESFIHKISKLSSQFVYFNDDTYIAKPVTWKTFFTATGKPINRHCKGNPEHSMDAHPYLYVQMMQNAISKFGMKNTRYHIQAQPFNKEIIKDYEGKFTKVLAMSAKHRYRQANDFNLLRFSTSMSSTDAKAKMKHTSNSYDYFTESSDLVGVQKIPKVKPTFLCINNNAPQNTHVRETLTKLFYAKSPFELTR